MNKEISKQLIEMGEEDQKVRLNPESTEEDINKCDKINTQKLKVIISQIGWPTNTKVSAEASQYAWGIAQHADQDINFQKECLELMKKVENEIEKKNIAYLEDRISVAEGKPQTYGTQFDDKVDYLQLQPVKDFTNLNEIRLAMGLNTIEDYVKEMEEAYQVKVILN